MFVTNWISTTKIQKISEITNFFRHYFLSRTEVKIDINMHALVLFICGLYQMPASVYELMVQSISDGPFVS